jgi:protein-tyrosine phosphatase
MRVLMVCLGNICRSPMAEAVLANLRPDWTVDSAGTGGWHAGERPDHRTLSELQRHGIATRHRGRQVAVGDFTDFDLILAMDRQNLRDLQRLRPAGATARLELLGAHDPDGVAEVPDPYHDGPEAFAAIYRQITRCCTDLAGRPPG